MTNLIPDFQDNQLVRHHFYIRWWLAVKSLSKYYFDVFCLTFFIFSFLFLGGMGGGIILLEEKVVCDVIQCLIPLVSRPWQIYSIPSGYLGNSKYCQAGNYWLRHFFINCLYTCYHSALWTNVKPFLNMYRSRLISSVDTNTVKQM